MASGEIEPGERPRQEQVGVGVEPPIEFRRLVDKVGLHLEVGGEEIPGEVLPLLKPPSEPGFHTGRREVGQVSHHAGGGQAADRPGLVLGVASPAPLRVSGDGVPGDPVPADALRREAGAAGDRYDGIDLVRELRRPLERLHAAERAAGDPPEPPDPEFAESRPGCPDDVSHRDARKVGSVRTPGAPGRGSVGRWCPRIRPADSCR